MSTESTERRATNSDATRLFSKTTYTTGELGCREFTGGCLNRDGTGVSTARGKQYSPTEPPTNSPLGRFHRDWPSITPATTAPASATNT